MAYVEQLGTCRHGDGRPDAAIWYSLTPPINGRAAIDGESSLVVVTSPDDSGVVERA
jgi:hypothetical protein